MTAIERSAPLAAAPFATRDGDPVEWIISEGLTSYEKAVAEMEARAALIAQGEAPERVWLVEHPSLYTAGTSAKPHDLIGEPRFPVFKTGRGGSSPITAPASASPM